MDIYQETTAFYKSVQTEKRVIGKSVFGRDIYAVKMGEGRPIGLVQYTIHARERIVTKLAFEHFRLGLKTGSAWLVPLVNPDGALLSEQGICSARAEYRKELYRINGGNDFSLWKANGRGVDLNVNWNADWGRGAKNVRLPQSENYIGKYPFSEPETHALKAFTEAVKPDYTVSYHTKGEEIYWYYYQPLSDCTRDKKIALALSACTGYKLAYAKGSAGGYKDWCIKTLKIPAYTIEAGRDDAAHPLGEDEFWDILKKNASAIETTARAVKEFL